MEMRRGSRFSSSLIDNGNGIVTIRGIMVLWVLGMLFVNVLFFLLGE